MRKKAVGAAVMVVFAWALWERTISPHPGESGWAVIDGFETKPECKKVVKNYESIIRQTGFLHKAKAKKLDLNIFESGFPANSDSE